MVVLELT